MSRPGQQELSLSLSIFVHFLRSDDDDINDVATMGGVNLSEESRNILSASSELIGSQVRSCRDEPFLDMSVLNARIQRIGTKLTSTPFTFRFTPSVLEI